MSFVQSEFIAFFAVVYILYWAVHYRIAQNLLLIVASALFYGWIHPFWLVLLYAAAGLDYAGGLGMAAWPAHKGKVLALSLAGNLGLLGYYKYCDFFLTSVGTALHALGVASDIGPIGVLLPAGISFYTFQSMAYSIDVYRGDLKPRKNLLDYILAVSFFCHLVAGPVQRAGNLLVQAETKRVFRLADMRSGFGLILWGAFKKIVCAGTVSPFVDKVYGLAHPSGGMLWAATLGFTVQILADFSGYTDMARGTARMLGWELMENFRHPYLAENPSDFWQRWHVSFSSWIRDYLYISLGGSRGGFWRTTAVTFLTMTLSGLWHGAHWNFVLWGMYHATLLVLHRLVAPRIPTSLAPRPLAIALMFVCTVFGWFLFRETDLSRMLQLVTLSPLTNTRTEWIATVTMLVVTGISALPLFGGLLYERLIAPRLAYTPWRFPVDTVGWTAMAICLFVFQRMDAMNFIYFRF